MHHELSLQLATTAARLHPLCHLHKDHSTRIAQRGNGASLLLLIGKMYKHLNPRHSATIFTFSCLLPPLLFLT